VAANEILANLTVSAGALASIYLDQKGNILASAGKKGKDLELVASAARGAFEAAAQLSRELGRGPLQEVVVGYAQGPILIRALSQQSPSALLVVELSSFDKLGQTRIHLARALEDLAN
jgi:predicted regulator of Ras-like GTPase activity (Roadblock/LC7/MglB family)